MGKGGAFYRYHVCEKKPGEIGHKAEVVRIDEINAPMAGVAVGWYFDYNKVVVPITYCPWCAEKLN